MGFNLSLITIQCCNGRFIAKKVTGKKYNEISTTVSPSLLSVNFYIFVSVEGITRLFQRLPNRMSVNNTIILTAIGSGEWRLSPYDPAFPCPFPQACLGSTNSGVNSSTVSGDITCLDGYSGYLCATPQDTRSDYIDFFSRQVESCSYENDILSVLLPVLSFASIIIITLKLAAVKRKVVVPTITRSMVNKPTTSSTSFLMCGFTLSSWVTSTHTNVKAADFRSKEKKQADDENNSDDECIDHDEETGKNAKTFERRPPQLIHPSDIDDDIPSPSEDDTDNREDTDAEDMEIGLDGLEEEESSYSVVRDQRLVTWLVKLRLLLMSMQVSS